MTKFKVACFFLGHGVYQLSTATVIISRVTYRQTHGTCFHCTVWCTG